jgi:hypothetical protein
MIVERVTLRLTAEQYRAADELARRQAISLNSVVRQAVEHWCALPERARAKAAASMEPAQPWSIARSGQRAG